jgi:FlaA1/EpsC-like NDP-sugar epimerase
MQKILIVGAGVAGQDVLRELRKMKNSYKVVGFIDDNETKKNIYINSTQVLGARRLIPLIVKKKKINEVIIAMPSAEGEEIADIVRFCVEAKVKFKIVPRVKEIIEGKAQLQTLRKVNFEDLLGRPVVKSDVESLKNFFLNKKVLVTGAAGSIGSELSRQICAYRPEEVILIDWWENGMFELQMELVKLFPDVKIHFYIANITDKKRMSSIFNIHKPNYVFHAAAYKHVPLMEDNPTEAVKNNIFGTLNIATIAVKNKVDRFVLVSTDKAANPKNIMGATKLVTEAIAKKLNGRNKFMAVRFGNVLGSFGSVIPTFKKQIEDGGPVTITDKRMTRYFMTIPEAAQLILKAGSLGNGGELFVLDMGRPVKIVDLAEQLIRLFGLQPNKDIRIVYTGVRKGEKINEKLFNGEEKRHLIQTLDQKIFITESLGIDLKKLTPFLKKLKIVLKTEDPIKIRKEISSLIKTL